MDGGKQLKQKFFIDFDLTIVDSISAFCSTYNFYYKNYPEFQPADPSKITSYDFRCICPLLKTQEDKNKIWGSDLLFYYLTFINDNTHDVLKKLNEKYQLVIVSIGTPKNIALKAKWLNNTLPFIKDYVLITNEGNVMDKSIVNMQNGIFIDDIPSNLESSNAEVKILFGKTYPWNKNWLKAKCLDWSKVEKMFL